ncbi:MULTISPECIES: hypothetical protein [Acidobacteriaceae]|uniref:hypothetical protein n=1 Tax=Acidobacteriaceae TaxID=204434 RepID=UPI0020B16626|nr:MULTISPECIES: hypothetical protein [Acidobacteriaceae]MDW5266655.1 hypothetical protein [Edaphobacter sp.]
MVPKSFKSKLLHRIRKSMNGALEAKIQAGEERIYDSQLLQGRMACWQTRSREKIQSLQEIEFKVFSQWGEDGIIDWLIERAAIPVHLHTFVEFGVESYREANTRFLLENRNWRGLVMDGDPALAENLKRDPLFWRYDLTAKSAFITRENVNDLIESAGFSGEVGLLSIDVDGNDYWVWEAISVIQPVICVCEYNAVFGDLQAISVPYDPEFISSRSHFSHLYFGASIAALRSLAARKGYRFVGTTSAANDAFFIREDYAQRLDSALMNKVALASKNRSSRDRSGQLTHIGGIDRLKLISNMSVVKIETGDTVSLGDLGPVYSEDWLQQIAGVSKMVAD